MSWFKKFFQKFQNDSDKTEFIQKGNKELFSRDKQESEGSKTVQAKVSYQYPKGSFRFPIIPDKNEPDHKKPKRPVRPQQQDVHKVPSMANKTSREQVDERSNKDIGQPLIKNKQNPLTGVRLSEQGPLTREKPSLPDKSLREKMKPEIRRSGPFKPSEIPSPIFGYERPKQIKVVEHELSGFLNEKDLHRDSHTNDEMNQDFNQVVNEIEIQPAIKVENGTILEAAQEVSAASEGVLVEEIVEYNMTTIQTPSASPLHDIILQDSTVINPDASPKESRFIEQNNSTEEGTSVEQDASTEEGTSFLQDASSEDGASIEQNGNTVGTTGIKQESSPLKEERSTKRSHLPFNVLMLKQDRIKLEQKKLRQVEELKNDKTEAPPLISYEQKIEEQLVVNDELETTVESLNTQSILENNLPEEEAKYQFPAASLLTPPVVHEKNSDWLQEQEELLNQTLINFNVGAKVVNVTQGPSVTRFEVQPDPGVKVNKITNLTDDIKLSLAARDIRIEAPIPGKHTIGIEVPNEKSRPVLISEILFSSQFNDDASPLTAALGLDISGKPVVTDLRKMPHGLIAGATGSGKSVCINTMLVSLLYKANPQEVKLLLIDPKMVELAPYNHIPHLVSPVITDVKAATAALKWAVEEMERRYELFVHTGVREITRFNEMAEGAKRFSDKLPYIIIVIDELADLMMVSPADVEEAICRIAQKARACGIHLVVATQRPSVDVITGLIKANIPTRIAFSVSSQVDSRTIIDISGAEKLLGRGDMLFLENGSSKPVRLQGTYISDIEIDKVVEHVRKQGDPEYLFEQTELLKKAQATEEEDELFYEACEFVIEQGGASTSSLQRRFKIGYNRAARLIDLMQEQGFISEARGSKPRDVLITEADLESI